MGKEDLSDIMKEIRVSSGEKKFTCKILITIMHAGLRQEDLSILIFRVIVKNRNNVFL